MNDKPTWWEYVTTIIVLVLCACWAWYDYQNDPDRKIPFEPLIAVVGYVIVFLGYLRWKKTKEAPTTSIVQQEADKIYNNDNIGNATFGNVAQQTNIATQYVTYGEEQIPRFLTLKPSKSGFFVGRDTDLAAIETDYLRNNHLLILVNGEGGIGKTTLATEYWHKHESRYKHLAWVFADSGIGNALLSLKGNLGVQFQPQDDTKTQIARITEVINNLDNPCLLVFDNANNAADLEQYFGTLRRLSNCHILLTSRVTVLEDVPVHRVLPLDKDFAVQVFKKHYSKHTEAEKPLLDALLHAVGYNTLVIELLAKNLAVFNKFQTQYSLASLVADLQERGLLAVQGKAVKTLYQADGLRTETPDSIIAAMYDVSALSETERFLLNNFAVLPAENIPYTVFMQLLKPDTADVYDAPLSALQQKGWIDYYEVTKDFKISPVIQYITRRKNADTLLDDCDTLIDTLIDELHPDKIHEDDYKMSTVFTRYAETVVAVFDEPNFNAVLLCERIGIYYNTVGNLDRAIYFYEKCNVISKELCERNPKDEILKNGLAISYEKLGSMYTSLGNLDKALGFYEGYNRLEKELYVAYPTNVEFKNGLAISYQYLGITHTLLGNLSKALFFYEDYNRLEKELSTSYSTNVEFKNLLAISYQYLGITHTCLGNLDKALVFYEDCNRLEKELYVAYPTNLKFKNGLAVSYSKLGNTHRSLGNLDKALGFYEEYNRLEKELCAAYPTNVSFKNGLAISYAKLAIFYLEKDKAKAKVNLIEAEKHLSELHQRSPKNVQFKQYLGIVQEELKELD
jgi:tetratricopeptide (TPR) repeat protein